ncbi:cysteine and histidine-rich domain-containing protein 1 [Aplysia californica]|uniref:Cysteine and histidine-rich domain-containing protein 1 n=1 Tax=Aplysia californica TaxID=6500 RepID=A0ABM0JB35_APLCA|nr:cysteine and histidine-rich domain-containing protein 1 [Aplysia californica]
MLCFFELRSREASSSLFTLTTGLHRTDSTLRLKNKMASELLTCYNKGCGQKFKTEDNAESACEYHPGGPIFHDALKGWSCCKKRVSDFTEFLNIKGCTRGFHCDVKPPEPQKPEKSKVEDSMIQLEVKPQHRHPNPIPEERPSADEPILPLKTTIGASLKALLEKLSLKDTEEVKENAATEGAVKLGTSCHNKGCKASYQGEQSNQETCVYHPGVPIFHEGMKYWTCCQRKTSDFDAFLNQEGCETGCHNWIKPKMSEEKQVRMDWHQTPSTVCLSIFAKVAMPDRTVVKANRVCCQVDIVYEGGNNVYNKTFILREAIDPNRSDVKLLGTKVEINLKKASAFSWPSLELPPPATSS